MNLSARIIKTYPKATELEPEELFTMSWGKIPGIVVDEPKYKHGRLSSRCFYNDVQFIESNRVFSITWEDIGEETIGNKTYVSIQRTRKILSDMGGDFDHTTTSVKKVEKTKLYEFRRSDAIKTLIAGSKNTSIEGNVDAIYKHYYNKINAYIDRGSNDFEIAINEEQDLIMLGHLNSYLIIGYDGVVGATSGTTPLYYGYKDENGNYVPITLRQIILNNITKWKI